jgi:voltage-gated potassium channel
MAARGFFIIISLLALLTGVGTLGYRIIERWNWLDAFYMTIITLTTTGFKEVHPMSDEGRILTIVLIIFGMGTVIYSINYFFNLLISIDFKERRRRKMEKAITKLEGHTIICGYGRMGQVMAAELHGAMENIVIIENNEKTVELLKQTEYFWISGDATHDDTLKQAGVEKANVIVSMVDNDSDGLYISLAARTLNPKIHIVIRANNEDAQKKMMRAGANKVFLPTIMSGKRVAQNILNPAVEDFLEITSVHLKKDEQLQLVDIDVNEKTQLVGKNLSNCGIKREGLIIVGIKKSNNKFIFAPSSVYPFENGDCLIALGTSKSYEHVMETLGSKE